MWANHCGEHRRRRHHQEPDDVEGARRTACPLPRHWPACPRRPFRSRGDCGSSRTWPAFRSACRPPPPPRPSAHWPAHSCSCPGSWRPRLAARSHHYLLLWAGPRRRWRGSSPEPRPGSGLVGGGGYLGACGSASERSSGGVNQATLWCEHVVAATTRGYYEVLMMPTDHPGRVGPPGRRYGLIQGRARARSDMLR